MRSYSVVPFKGSFASLLFVVPVLKLIPPLLLILLEITNLLLSCPTKPASKLPSCLNHICGLEDSLLSSSSASMITIQSPLAPFPEEMCNLPDGSVLLIPTLPSP